MKLYQIIADNITGIKGKQLFKGETHAETEILHCKELEDQGFIKEVTAQTAPAEQVQSPAKKK